MWEAYSKNKGVCLKFDFDKLNEYLSRFNSRNYLGYEFKKVIYDENSQITILNQILKKNYKKYFKINDPTVYCNITYTPQIIFEIDETEKISFLLNELNISLRKIYTDFLLEAVRELLYIAPFIQHPFWNEEDEYRLVFYRPLYNEHLDDPSIIKREDKYIYYIDLEFDMLLIEELIISPKSAFRTDQLDVYKKSSYSSGKDILI